MMSVKTLLVFTLTAAGFAAAQNFTFDPSQVELTTKNRWCQGELNNCPTLCGGTGFVKPGQNLCDGSSLTYTCTCSNGTQPTDIGDYVNTLPNYICTETFAQCVKANPNSVDSTCKKCGTLQPSDVPASSSSMSAAASSTEMASATDAAAPAATTSNAAVHPSVGSGVGTGLVGGLVAALLL